jgi:aldehyde:ferredoxin oxidoreductase
MTANGLAGSVLRMDLTQGRVRREPIEVDLVRAFLGGRGLNVARLLRELPIGMEPLAPEAPLLAGVGPLVGTSFPGGARFNISARSPQTRILGDSNAGGFFGPELRFAGFDQLVITGRAPRPVFLWIDDDRVSLEDARGLWGKDTVETTMAIQQELGSCDVQVAVVGPAAEHGVLFSGVFANLTRPAARTGMGAVMASKNLKAIAVRGTGEIRVADPGHFRECIARLNERILAHPEYEIRTRLGTTRLVEALQAIGGLPARHFQSGLFEAADDVSGQVIEERFKVRGKACFACTIPCSRYLLVDDPRFPKLRFEGPEYEPLAGFTARVGNADLPLALAAVDRCNRLGMDAISVSEVIAWVMELGQRGMLASAEADGLDLDFGCGETILALVEEISRREGFGDILADGVRAASHKLERGQELAMEVKGLELFQADVRAMKGYALGNAVASRGADHLRSEPWFEFSGDRDEAIKRYGIPEAADRLAWKGKGRLVAHFEEMAAISDALGVCKNTYNNMEVLDWEETAELLVAATGWPWIGEEVRRVGERIVNAERVLNARWGITRRDDRLPRRFLKEPAGPPDSPSAGSVVELGPMLEEYYSVRGWNLATGVPTAGKLQDLGLEG